MRKTAVKTVLVSLLGISSALAQEIPKEQSELFLIEELSPKVRANVYKQVLEMIKTNPSLIDSDSVLALDKKGTVYVLDKNKPEVVLGKVGEPSCAGLSHGL